MKVGSPFPHYDIPDKGPPLSAALCLLHRDDPEYRGHPDHDANGLLHGGPGGEHCSLAGPQGFTFCAHPDRTVPENERKRHVTYKGRTAAKRRAEADDDEPAPPPRMVWAGKFLFPGRPANSGRKRKTA